MRYTGYQLLAIYFNDLGTKNYIYLVFSEDRKPPKLLTRLQVTSSFSQTLDYHTVSILFYLSMAWPWISVLLVYLDIFQSGFKSVRPM